MKCGECPLALRCYGGKLEPIAWCLHCHYTVVKTGDTSTLGDTIANQVRLRCQLRTEALYGGPTMQGVVRDPIVAKNQLAVTKCAKCEMETRKARGWSYAIEPEEFNAVELD